MEVIPQVEHTREPGAGEPGFVSCAVCQLGVDQPLDAAFDGRVAWAVDRIIAIVPHAVWLAVDGF